MKWKVLVKSDPVGEVREYDLVTETAEYAVCTVVQQVRDRIPWHNILWIKEDLHAETPGTRVHAPDATPL